MKVTMHRSQVSN